MIYTYSPFTEQSLSVVCEYGFPWDILDLEEGSEVEDLCSWY